MKKIMIAIVMTCFASSVYGADVLWLECSGTRSVSDVDDGRETVTKEKFQDYWRIDTINRQVAGYNKNDNTLRKPDSGWIITDNFIELGWKKISGANSEDGISYNIDRRTGAYSGVFRNGNYGVVIHLNSSCRPIDPPPIRKNAF